MESRRVYVEVNNKNSNVITLAPGKAETVRVTWLSELFRYKFQDVNLTSHLGWVICHSFSLKGFNKTFACVPSPSF